jgi:opacity protein-like surface antigen
MRAVILGAATVLCAGNAMAADYLRGATYDPPPLKGVYRWQGAYFGGQAGYSQMNASFGPAIRAPLGPFFVPIEPAGAGTWPRLPNGSESDVSYGGFVGYNAQWNDVVLGLEANYNYSSLTASSNLVAVSTRPLPDVLTYSGSARLLDVVTFRARAGYAWDWFMPYVFAGVAIGRVDTTRTVAPLLPAPFYPITESSTEKLVPGYTLGAGVDIGLSHNFFLRGEYEYVELTRVNGVGIKVNTVRAGAGVKF